MVLFQRRNLISEVKKNHFVCYKQRAVVEFLTILFILFNHKTPNKIPDYGFSGMRLRSGMKYKPVSTY